VRTESTAHLAAGGDDAVAALPRVLKGVPASGAMSLHEHVAVHGPSPTVHADRRQGAHGAGARLIEEVAAAGLLGRGGAAFPAARKMRAVADARGRPIVIANGAEGEPASLKDHTLLELLPHLVLDGAVLAAEAVGAHEVIVAACQFSGASVECVAAAIEERATDLAGSRRAPRVRLEIVPGHYVAGQESALVNYLGGGPAKPTFTPPMPFEVGLARRPTLVNNVETLAHIALIARRGAAWFRELGTPSQPGSALVTLTGAVAHPGVYEIEQGASLASLLDAAGGATARVRAVLLGGYAGSWIGAEHLRGVALSDEHLAVHRATLGAGVVLLLSEHACPVAETVHVARWLAEQSTHQCGPCTHGLDALATAIAALAHGGDHLASQRAERLASLTARRGACGHPDGAVRMLLSSLDTFAIEFADHVRNGPCERCAREPELPLPHRPVSGQTLPRRGGRA
jgi:NADH:ubiquinone oxidoreductase subunit F (NADH-binding)